MTKSMAKLAPFTALERNIPLFTEVLQFVGFIDVILGHRLVCKRWSQFMISDEVWSFTLQTDYFMYLKWQEYVDDRMLTIDNPMQPTPNRTMFQWYKWHKQQMLDRRQLEADVGFLIKRAKLEDEVFEKQKGKMKRMPLKGEENAKHLRELVRSTILAYTNINCVNQFTERASKKGIVGMGCDDGKVLLVDAQNLTPTVADPSEMPRFDVIDEHDGAVTLVLSTPQFLFTVSNDCTVGCFDLDCLVRPKVVLIGHSEAVTCIAVHRHDDRMVVTGSLDRQVLIWNVEQSNKPLHVCRGHAMKVVAIEVTSDRIFSGARDSSLHIWDWQGRALRVLTGHLGPIVGLKCLQAHHTMLGDAFRLVSACAGGMVRVWNATSGRVLGSAIVAKQTVCVELNQPRMLLICGTFDGTVIVRDLQHEINASLIFHTRAVRCIQTTDTHFFTAGDDCNVAVWDWAEVAKHVEGEKGKKTRSLQVEVLKPYCVLQHSTFINALLVRTFQTSGKISHVVASTADKRYHVWRVCNDPEVLKKTSDQERAALPEKVKLIRHASRKSSTTKATASTPIAKATASTPIAKAATPTAKFVPPPGKKAVFKAPGKPATPNPKPKPKAQV